MSRTAPFTLVTGATGKQGGATARSLLDHGRTVHALVRDPDAPAAVDLRARGATLVVGDLNDPASLKGAVGGAQSVFSVQMPDLADLMGDSEVRQGRNLIDAAAGAGVEHVVHTSVSGAGAADVDDVDADRWGAHMAHYWSSKAAVERAVREAGFPYWTVLRPSTFMENFVRPSFYFADETSNRLVAASDPDVPTPLIAVSDIGAAAAAALADPRRFGGMELELAGDHLSFRAVADAMSGVLGERIEIAENESAADGVAALVRQSQEYMTAHPAPARPEFARELGLPTTTFAEWAVDNLK